ncbi:putative reticulon-like protein RtnA [Dipodascopsis uninucleata]
MAEKVPVGNFSEVTPNFLKYKAFFTDILTWKNIYVSGGAFIGSIGSLILLKYVNIVKVLLNASYLAFGTAIAIEFAGRTVRGSKGFVSSLRSGKYFVVSRDVVDPVFNEFIVLLNFVLIEIQQIAFVESVPLTVLAFFGSYFTYFLIQYVTLWSLSLFVIIFAFSLPPIYVQFQPQIDAHILKAEKIIEAQGDAVKAKANEHFGKTITLAKGYVDQGLDKVGYKRNLPPVPPASTTPEPENIDQTTSD